MWQNGRKNNVSPNHRKANQNSPVKNIHHLFTSWDMEYNLLVPPCLCYN